MNLNYKEGYIVSGIVTAIMKYGIFVDIGNGVQGFIHISEISNFYINNIDEYFEIGDVIKARIISKNNDRNNITLSLRSNFKKEFLPIKKDQYNSTVKHQVNNRNNQRSIPTETKSGFLPLKEMLPKWIEKSKQS